ncbi:MAG TPA: M10 family metallopeptidase C-terminal domain-containing protein [Xanthobacteraceae bacterium]|nr:M10 family metallopeptidase C-terminal domain-containing protein [Xanthobacteraceae bacterium]
MATGNVFIDVLAHRSWLDVGGDRNITYYFDEASPDRKWTAFEKVIWRAALQEWANVANITTQELSSPAGADIIETWSNSTVLTLQFGLSPTGGPWAAAHYLPLAGGGSLGEYNTAAAGSIIPPASLAVGGYGWWIAVHELGHGLGLSHPHGMVQLENEPFFPGVTRAGDLGDFEYNQQVYTIMSYNGLPNAAPFTAPFNTYGLPAGPMAFDIAAMQQLYGPNTTFHNGADTYVLPDGGGAGTFWRCIWDTGGTDTIRYDGSFNATIDLRAATLVFGDPIAGGAMSRVGSTLGGYTIANGVVIENAVGGRGNDTLRGNSADNILNGGPGDDTVIFSGPQSAYTVTDIGGGSVRVTGPEGTDTLISIEHMQFLGGVTGGSNNVLFDASFYLSHNPDVSQAGVDALNHFNTFGWREDRDPNALFDTSWYRALYKDAAGTNPLDHYHATGWKKGYDPSADFDTKLYLLHNPDVAAANVDPLEHYLRNGKSEGRAIYAAIGDAVNGFDAQYYLLHNPDVAAAGADPLQHFNQFGWHEGRNPNAWFDMAGYLSHYTDVAASGVNPLQHYEQFGWREGRDPSTQFDTLKYLAAYADVAAAGVNPFDHFLQNGIYEGRSPQGDGLWH